MSLLHHPLVKDFCQGFSRGMWTAPVFTGIAVRIGIAVKHGESHGSMNNLEVARIHVRDICQSQRPRFNRGL